MYRCLFEQSVFVALATSIRMVPTQTNTPYVCVYHRRSGAGIQIRALVPDDSFVLRMIPNTDVDNKPLSDMGWRRVVLSNDFEHFKERCVVNAFAKINCHIQYFLLGKSIRRQCATTAKLKSTSVFRRIESYRRVGRRRQGVRTIFSLSLSR